ncbi:MAG: WXG100 family type VII secretion target, partial [Phycisphaerae bacterium]|nr:WXG100 family type VII secretion target [Phycisphaerae bacterium]
MAKANVDPAELRRFARELKRFNTDLESLTNGLYMRMRNLEKTWQDQEQRKFSEEFDQTIKTLARFMDASN